MRKMPLQNASAINRLPPELLGHVFSYISLQAPSDIANCRLVSRAFKVLSSPHLIPKVVFARRLGAVSKLCEILQHPYFRLHVTELEYDSSAYSEVTATSWDQYVEDYERAPRELENPEWLKRQDSVQHAREKISAFCKSVCDERQDSSIWDGALADTHVTSKSSYDSAESSLTAREAFLVGCSTTFADYRQRFADQQWIRKEGIDMTILAAAFVRFPKLRSIVFTDYRSLARKGESYDVCCQRLFGRTLEPQHVGGGGLTGVPGDCLFSILDVLAEHLETHIESLVIGPPHQFEYTGENASELADPYYPQNPRYLDLSSLENISLGSESKIGLILGRLRYLRLVLCYSGKRLEEGEMHAQIHRFLESSAPQLSSLMVHMVYLFWGGAREVPRVDHDVHFDFFRSTLMPLHIPRLQSLSLRPWIFTAQEVKTRIARVATRAFSHQELPSASCLGIPHTRDFDSTLTRRCNLLALYRHQLPSVHHRFMS